MSGGITSERRTLRLFLPRALRLGQPCCAATSSAAGDCRVTDVDGAVCRRGLVLCSYRARSLQRTLLRLTPQVEASRRSLFGPAPRQVWHCGRWHMPQQGAKASASPQRDGGWAQNRRLFLRELPRSGGLGGPRCASGMNVPQWPGLCCWISPLCALP